MSARRGPPGPALRGRVAALGVSRGDLAAAAVLAPLAVFNRVIDSPWWLLVVVALIVVLAVVFCRRRPWTALLVVLVFLLWSPGATLAAGVIGFRAGQHVARVTPPVVAVGVLWMTAGFALSRVEPSVAVESVVFAPLVVVLSWVAGHYQRQRRELKDREKQGLAEQARLRERERIALDMHDSLGHELGLIALRAGALQVASGLDEHAVRAAAAELRGGAATAAERLREVVGVLGSNAEGAIPAESGESVSGLVERAKESGMPVTLRIEVGTESVPDMVERAVRRVVQEALTNAAKHAPGAQVAVRIDRVAAETVVTVTNGTPTRGQRPASPGSGVGHLGLQERVRLAGGTFSAAPVDDGFEVSARLPHVAAAGQPAETASGSVRASAPPHFAEEMRRQRRDFVLSAVALVAGTTALVTLAAYYG